MQFIDAAAEEIIKRKIRYNVSSFEIRTVAITAIEHALFPIFELHCVLLFFFVSLSIMRSHNFHWFSDISFLFNRQQVVRPIFVR